MKELAETTITGPADDILYLVAPAYNEEETIESFVSSWYPVVERHPGNGRSRLLIVNDGSRDNTYARLLALQEGRPYLSVLSKPNGGHGPAVLFGYRKALAMAKEDAADLMHVFLFQTDTDGQTVPSEFETFWNMRSRYEAVFGERTHRGDGKSRAFVEHVLCRILRHRFGVSLRDANAPFRLMRADYVTRYLPLIPEDYNLPNVLLTVFGAYYQNNIAFSTITFRPRQGGKNSINVRKIVVTGIKALRDFTRISRALPDEAPQPAPGSADKHA